MPYVHGEPEGLGRKDAEDLKKEEERLRGGPHRSPDLRTGKVELAEKQNLSTGGKREVSTEEYPDELATSELNPEQALELKEAISHGYADIAQNPREDIQPETPKTLEDLRRRTEQKEIEARRNKRLRK